MEQAEQIVKSNQGPKKAAIGLILAALGQGLFAQELERISVHAPGDPGVTTGDAMVNLFDSTSADGRFVTFDRDLGFKPEDLFDPRYLLQPVEKGTGADVFVRDRLKGTAELISLSPSGDPGDARSVLPRISADGRYVLFQSFATNLASGDDNGSWDVFLRDRELGETRLISRAIDRTSGSWGSGPIEISEDGSVVLFLSFADDLLPFPFTVGNHLFG